MTNPHRCTSLCYVGNHCIHTHCGSSPKSFNCNTHAYLNVCLYSKSL